MLIQMIKSEFKKIFKLKINVFLVVVAIIGPTVMSGMTYFNYTSEFSGGRESISGEYLSGLSFLRYTDEIRHQYAGEWSDELFQKYQQDFQKLYSQYKKEIIDERMMKMQYGASYNDLLKKHNDGTLLYKDIHEYRLNAGHADEDYEPQLANEKANLTIYYEETPIANTIQYAYGVSEIPNINEIFSSLNQYMKDKKINFDVDIEFLKTFTDFNDQDIKAILADIQEKSLSTSTYFDSTIPNQVLLANLNNNLWIPLICVLIILANTFGIEKQYNMEQLIYPTKASKFKITISKLIMGSLFSLVVMMFSILGCIIVGYILLPVHSWDVAAFGTMYRIFYPTYTIAYTYQSILIYTISLAMIAALAISALALSLSYLFKNRFYVVITLFLYFGISIFINLGAIADWLQYTHPYTMAHIFSYISPSTLAYTIINQQVIPQSLIATIFWIVITIVVYTLIIFRSKQKSAITL